MTETQRSEFAIKAYSKNALAGAGKENAGEVKTDEPEKVKTEAEKKTAEFTESVRKRLGIPGTGK
ncbi:MAG: hypothetical protein QM743_08665 [Chitinophagaceae bacterium]